MPNTREPVTAVPPPDYDPARADRIRELVEQMRATNDPAEIDQLEDELDALIFRSPVPNC